MTIVVTGALIKFIVSVIDSPAVTDPPGELIYIEISFVGSCASKKSNWATIDVAMLSSTSPCTKTIRSFNKREGKS